MKRPKPKHRLVQPHEIDRWLDQATRRLARTDYPGVISTTQRVLRHTAASPEQRAAALLATLPSFRQSPEPPISRISGPFDGHNLKKSLTFRIDQ